MTISKEPIRYKHSIDKNPIEEVMFINYLGSKIFSYGNLKDEVRAMINKATATLGHLKYIWKNADIETNCKSVVLKS